MNAQAQFIQRHDIQAISVEFEPGGKQYTYLVPYNTPVTVGQFVFVQVRNEIKRVRIVSLDAKIDPDAKFTYKFILGVEAPHYQHLTDKLLEIAAHS